MPKYPMLPIMQCDPNCGECCGPVVCTQGEFVAASEYAARNGIVPKDQGTTCPWYQGGKCSIHPVRPAVCRLFGHVPGMECCKGYNVNINGALLRKWNSKVVSGYRWMHEFITGWTVARLGADLKLGRSEFTTNMRKVNQ